MTPSQSLSYEVGDRFEIIVETDGFFEKGSVVELIDDDGSYIPEFKLIKGICVGDTARLKAFIHVGSIAPCIGIVSEEPGVLPPEAHNTTPIDGARALDIIRGMF